MNGLPQLSIVIESRLDCVPLAGVMVRTFCEGVGVPHAECGRIEVCIVEAANNSVVHAYGGEPGHRIEIRAARSAEELQFEIIDQGQAISPDELKQSHAANLEVHLDRLDLVREDGRGLAIIESVMERLQYLSTPEGNHFVMSKRMMLS